MRANSNSLFVAVASFVLADLPIVEGEDLLLRLNIDFLEPFELRHDLRITLVLIQGRGVSAADAVNVA